jgi:serine/threonine-protein kinase
LILEENGVNPSWSPTGHILFDREGGIWALPFSSDRLEPEGAPFLVEPGFSNAGVSIDGALLAVTSRVQGQRLRLTIRNRYGRLIRKLGPPLFRDRFRARHPTVSPDAKRVAVSGSLQRGAPNDIWVFDLDGGRPLRLTSDVNVEDNPVWTPDGTRILFRKNAVSGHPNDRVGDADFYIVDAAGAGPVEPFLENDIRLAEPDFSPSGRVLIFQQRELESGQWNIYYLPAQEPGAEAQPVPWLDSAFNEAHPQFSPSGKYVAYASGETGLGQIHVRPFPEGSPVWQVSLEGGNSPRWSPDGRELYWHGDSEGSPLMAADVDFGRSNPFGQPTPLFPTGGFAATYYYDVMPNGQFILLEPDEEDDAESAPPIYFRVIQNWYEQFRTGADAE